MIYLSNSPNNKDRALRKGKQSKLLSLLFAPGKTVCLGGKGDFGELSLTKERGAPHYFWPGGSEFFFFWRGDHMIFRGKRNGNQYYLAEFKEGTIEKLSGTD